MANIFLLSHILLLFHSPKGSWNKSAKYEKIGKYWSYCTQNRAKLMLIASVFRDMHFWVKEYSTWVVKKKNGKLRAVIKIKPIDTYGIYLKPRLHSLYINGLYINLYIDLTFDM